MGQPSTDKQVRAVALREAVASMPSGGVQQMTLDLMDVHEGLILARAEKFADYIENGVAEDA